MTLTYADLDVVVEGFDVATGATTWAVPVGAVEGLVYGGGVGAIAGPQEILLPTTNGPSLVDLLSGRTRPPEPTAVPACDSPVVAFDYDDPFYIDGTPITERYGEALTVACHPDRSPAQQPLSRPVLATVSISVGGAYVHATDQGLVGYPADDPQTVPTDWPTTTAGADTACKYGHPGSAATPIHDSGGRHIRTYLAGCVCRDYGVER